MSGLSPISPSSAAQPTQQLSPQVQAGAQSGAYNTIGGLGAYNQYNPSQFGALTSNITNNPYAGQFQQGANQASQMGMQGAQALQGAAGSVLNTAFDPQQALYQRTLQQEQQQSNAQMAQSGIGSTPYAAGLQNQNLQNFNTTWQAQQLQNQIAGLGAAGTAYNTAAPLAYSSAQYPYAASTGMAQTGMQALSSLLGYGQTASNLSQTQISDYLSLLGLQPALAGAQNQTAATQAQLQALQMNELMAGIKGAASLGGSLGGLGPSSGSGTQGMGGWS